MRQATSAVVFLLALASAPERSMAETLTCLAAPYQSAETTGQIPIVSLMARLRAALADFPALVTALESRGPAVCLSVGMIDARAFFEPDSNRIVLASGMEPGLELAVLVHEIRHLYQFQYGVCPSGNLAMREYARAVFAMEADANVVALLVAWKLRSAGDPQMWRALAEWPMTADIAARFAGILGTTGDVSAAAAAAFDQWYASDGRREIYYIAACGDYLDQSDRTHLFPGYRMLPDDFLTRLCRMPDGSTYPCAEAGNALER